MVALHAAFAAAMRVVDRIHRNAAHRWPSSMPACSAGLAVGHVFVVEISDLANRGHAIERKFSDLARGQLDESHIALLAQ